MTTETTKTTIGTRYCLEYFKSISIYSMSKRDKSIVNNGTTHYPQWKLSSSKNINEKVTPVIPAKAGIYRVICIINYYPSH